MDRIVAARDVSPVEMEQAGSGYLGEALYSRAPSRIDISIGGQTALLRDLCDTMKHGSLCALGGFTPYPVLSALDHFPEDFRSEEHTSELQSLMRISYAVFCLKKNKNNKISHNQTGAT